MADDLPQYPNARELVRKMMADVYPIKPGDLVNTNFTPTFFLYLGMICGSIDRLDGLCRKLCDELETAREYLSGNKQERADELVGEARKQLEPTR